MNQLVIIGASGHGKVVADIALKSGYDKIIYLDDNDSLVKCGDCPVVGNVNSFADYDFDMFVAIGDPKIRQKIQSCLESFGKHLAVLIHPGAIVAKNVIIGDGTAVMAGAVINPDSVVGKGCVINTCSSVDHDCVISDFVHISVGAHIAGTVNIGKRTWIGAGTTVSNNVNICEDCMIGAGAVVVKDINEPGTYIGCPARKK